jgi:hypothetical protein
MQNTAITCCFLLSIYMQAAVHTVIPMPGSSEHILVAARSTTAYLVTQQGAVVRR